MSSKYRLGIIGFGHMHINNVAQLFHAHPQVEWGACADTVPLRPEVRVAPYTRAWNKQHLMSQLGIPQEYADYQEMLAKEKLDIVIVTCENAQHPDVVEACAAAGVNVCVEKPMAMSMPDALRMARACRAADTTMLVNWPLTWSAPARKAKELIDAGAIGTVLEVRWRAGHNGPLGAGVSHQGVSESAGTLSGPEKGATWWHQEAAGGGALLDYCCYGCMVARWYVGAQAQAAVGFKANLASQWGDANDNGAMIVRFPGAFAMMEGSWTTRHHGVPTGPIVYGTEGTLVVDSQDGQPIVRIEKGAGQTAIHTPDPLPEGRTTIAEEYIYHLETGDPVHITLQTDFNLECMAILDAGARSADSGQTELVNESAWCIG